jgi:hypothetical protein
VTPIRVTPIRAIFSAVASALSPLRSAIITLDPAPAKLRAMASPMF